MGVLDPNQSSAMQFMNKLMDEGIVPKYGGFVLANVQHDDGCPTLRTQRTIDCRCCPDIVMDGYRYSFDRDTGEVFRSLDITAN